MFPRAADLTYDDCVRQLRSMELESYRNLISVFRAKGNLCDEKRRLLKELAQCMNISTERHQAETRKAASDDILSTISLQLTGEDYSREWYEEGQRTHSLPLRNPPPTVTSPMADYLGRVIIALHSKDEEDSDGRTLQEEIQEESQNFMKRLIPTIFGIQEEEEAHSDSSSSSETEVRVTRSGAQRRTNYRRNLKRRKVRKVPKEKKVRLEDVFENAGELHEILPSGREANASILEKIALPNLCDNPNLRRIRETSLRGMRNRPRNSLRAFQKRRRSNHFLMKKRVTNISSSSVSERPDNVNRVVEPLPNGEVEDHLETIEYGNHHCNSGDEADGRFRRESPEHSWDVSGSGQDGDSCEAQELLNGLESTPQIIKYEEGYVILSENSSDSNQVSPKQKQVFKVPSLQEDARTRVNEASEEGEVKNPSRGKEVFHFNTLCSEEDINDDLRMIYEGIQQATKEEVEDSRVTPLEGEHVGVKEDPEGTAEHTSLTPLSDEAVEETTLNGEMTDHNDTTQSPQSDHENHNCTHEAPDSYTLSAIECINFHDYFVTRPAKFISSVPEGSYS